MCMCVGGYLVRCKRPNIINIKWKLVKLLSVNRACPSWYHVNLEDVHAEK